MKLYSKLPVAVRRTLQKHQYSLVFLSCTFCAYMIFIFAHMLQIRPDGLWGGHPHVWGDWALHIGMANLFHYKSPDEWFAYHPYYAGGKLTYGFLTNMISGLLMRTGLPVTWAFLFPSMIYSVLLIFGMYVLFYQLLKTQKAALTAVSLFFLSSGLGFLRFLPDLLAKPSLQHLLYPTKDYTRIEPVYQWLAGNFVNGMLVPQRAFLLGMTISVWVLSGLVWVMLRVQQKPKKPLTKQERIVLVLAGLGAGLLPITHMHSFMVLIIVSAFFGLALIKQWYRFLWYGIPAGLLSIFLYFTFVKGGIENPEFMKILIGWTSKKDPTNIWISFVNWLKMWWEIWGVMMPVAIAGVVIAWKRITLPQRAVLYSGFAIFALANIILFQPILWDNSKLFLWAYFFFAGLAALVLQQLWRYKAPGRVIAIVLAILLAGSGVMELWRLARYDKNSYMMTNHAGLELARVVREKTDSQAIFLTAPVHDHPVMEWGARPVLLGYTAWAWNFGFMYHQREIDIREMYKGGLEADKLLKKHNISYVVFGPTELNQLSGQEEYYKTHFPLLTSSGDMRIYDVRSVTGGR